MLFNREHKLEKQGKEAETGAESCQQTGALGPQRGGWGGDISDSERQKKAERMGTERWPRVYLPRQAWQRSPALRGGPGTTVLMNVKGGGTSVNAQQCSEKMPERGAPQNHGEPGSGSGTCPGERRQEPFV